MVGIPEENKLSMYHEAAYINTFNIMNLLFTRFSHVRLFYNPMDYSCQAPLSMGFLR